MGEKTSANSIQTFEPIRGLLSDHFVLQREQEMAIFIWQKHKYDMGTKLLLGNKVSWFCEAIETGSTQKLQCLGFATKRGECHQSHSITSTKYTLVYQPCQRDG